MVLGCLMAGVTARANDDVEVVERAITEAVRARVGQSAEVRITVGQVRLQDDAGSELEARPVAGARLGRPTRFTLYRPSVESSRPSERVGYAVAEAHARVEHVRAAHPISRGTVLGPEDVFSTEGDIGQVALKPLPTLDQILGSTAARPLKTGALVGPTSIRQPTLVHTGDQVVTRVRVGAVVVAGRTTATQNGQLGDVVKLLNEQSGRRLRGRVVAHGEVEVVQ